jgi:Fe2+ or Zn2+ uptake regulation protein
MTGKTDFTAQEWELVLEGPPSAAMIVVTAARGGTIRETMAIAKAYVEARQHHGASELLDEIVAAKPEIDHTRYRSLDELKQHGLQHVRDAVGLLERKATADEVADYRRFVLTLADKVANAHREGGGAVSEAERAAIDEISASLGTADPG